MEMSGDGDIEVEVRGYKIDSMCWIKNNNEWVLTGKE